MIIWDIVILNTPIIMGGGNPREFKVTTFLPLQSKIVGVIFLFIYAYKVFAGHYENGGKRGWFTTMKGDYVEIEILGLYWHFVDLVWVFIFAFFYLW